LHQLPTGFQTNSESVNSVHRRAMGVFCHSVLIFCRLVRIFCCIALIFCYSLTSSIFICRRCFIMVEFQCERCGRWLTARRYELQLAGENVVREYRIRCPKCRVRYQIRIVNGHDQNLYDFALQQ